MRNTSHINGEKIESSIPKWVVFSLFFIATLIIVSIIRAYLPLLMSGIAMLFVWTQLTKEKAEITMLDNINTMDNNQFNLLKKKSKIPNRHVKTQSITTEPSGQRKRYLRAIEEQEEIAA